jgi:hypothetical protein
MVVLKLKLAIVGVLDDTIKVRVIFNVVPGLSAWFE